MPPRAIVADDTSDWREELTLSIQDHLPHAEVDTVRNGRALLNLVLSGEYDLAIIDNNMGNGPTGVDVVRAIRAAGIDIPIYIVSTGLSEEIAIEAGATGYGSKKSWSSDVLKALPSILVGKY